MEGLGGWEGVDAAVEGFVGEGGGGGGGVLGSSRSELSGCEV